MVLLVEALVGHLDRRLQLAHKRVNGLVERVEVLVVASVVALVTGKDHLLQLAQEVDLVLHVLRVFHGGAFQCCVYVPSTSAHGVFVKKSAIAVSYAAVCANAFFISLKRVSNPIVPPWSASSLAMLA